MPSLYLYLAHLVFTVLSHGNFISGLVYSDKYQYSTTVLYKSTVLLVLLHLYRYIVPWFREVFFFYNLVENLVCATDMDPFSSIPIITRFPFFVCDVPKFSMFLLCIEFFLFTFWIEWSNYSVLCSSPDRPSCLFQPTV